MPAMRLGVSAHRCSGHGRCYAVAPDLLAADENGFVTIRGEAVDVPAGSEAVARDAAAWCPESAIELSE
jgi:ferredoxin